MGDDGAEQHGETSPPEGDHHKGKLDDLKMRLRSLLIQHGGSTAHSEVIDTINQLSELNPTPANAPEWPTMFAGEFVAQTSPDFPGRLETEDPSVVQYTLGRLTFNTFQPQSTVCTLRGVRNLVHPRPGSNDFTYDLVHDITVHLPEGDIDAEIWNESICSKDQESGRVHVRFTGSTLSPSGPALKDESKMAWWHATFNKNAYKDAAAERSFFQNILHSLQKRFSGMSITQDTPHKVRLKFKKPFQGYLDILYLDKDIRITKGNKKTLVVVDRL